MNKNEFFKQVDPFVYDEIFTWNVYRANKDEYKDANILDIGAHYGLYTYLCYTLGAKKIVAVEANPYNYLHFIKNTLDIPNVKVINAAISNESGKIVTIDNNNEKSTIGKGDINVATITLKDIIQTFPVNEDIILKMDIEGAEYNVLYSAPIDVLRRFSSIAIEMHEFPNSDHKFNDLDQYIQNAGFKQVWHGTFFTVLPNDVKVPNDTIVIFKYKRI